VKVLVIAGNTIGGTEKAAALFACGLARKGFEVEMFSDPDGPRSAELTAAGVIIRPPRDLAKDLQESDPDVIHQHVSGYWKDNPLYAILAGIEGKKPKLIETNVFGRLDDPIGDQFVERRMFVSAASGCQAFLRAGRKLGANETQQNLVLYNPLASPNRISAEQRLQLRSQLGIREEELLAIRVGQPGHKWTDWEFRALQRVRRQGTKVKLLAMEPSAPLWQAVEQGKYGDGILLKPATSDFGFIEQLYQASDLMIHASSWGESFGYTLAEGMMGGMPVITRSTPWGDNAQVELVENGVTGFVCASVPEMARRLEQLANDPDLRQTMAKEGRARIENLCLAQTEVDVLADVIQELMTGQTTPRLESRRRVLLEFMEEFRKREFAFSEPFWQHPIDRAAAGLYMRYRCLRRWAGRRLSNRSS
jgi:hypothetical protein